jgi:hypothetical protein
MNLIKGLVIYDSDVRAGLGAAMNKYINSIR